MTRGHPELISGSRSKLNLLDAEPSSEDAWLMSEKVRVANEMPKMSDRKFRDKKVL